MLSKRKLCFSKKFVLKIINKSEEFILAFKQVTEKITDIENKFPCYFKEHVEKTKCFAPLKTHLKLENETWMIGVPK